MFWKNWLYFAVVLALAGLGTAEERKTSNQCDQVKCYQGNCVNGKCVCKAGWTGKECENCFGLGNPSNGERCEKCRDGYFGNLLNGENCTACECNGQATTCDSLTGKCHCTTKGVSGHNCDRCEQKYVGDPKTQSCYYELSTDFVFTFNLNREEDEFIRKINFVARPPKENADVTFKLTCSQIENYIGKVNLTIGQVEGDTWRYRRFLAGAACHDIERIFDAKEFQFGTSANTTFLVMLYDFRTPISITISFSQPPIIDWAKVFG